MTSGRLRSMLDMLKDNAADFMELGAQIGSTQLLWSLQELLTDDGKEQLRLDLGEILALARRLKLPTSMRLVGRRLGFANSLPRTADEFLVIKEVLEDELASQLFLFVPTDRAPYWEKDDHLSDKAKVAFPNAAAELRGAGNAYAASLPEGAVYYAMRALEPGLRALAADVGLIFDVQNWQNIINEIEAKIEKCRKDGIPGLDKADKDARLQFLSEAAKEFAYFKDRVAA